MARQPKCIEWEIGKDRYGRSVTLKREGADYSIRIHPIDQRDEGETIRSLSRDLLIEAGKVAEEQRG